MRKAGRRNSRARNSLNWTPLLILLVSLITLYLLWDVLLIFIIAAFIAFLLNPLVERLPKKIPRAVSIIIVYLVILVVLGGLIGLLTPIVVQQYQQLSDNIPTYITQARDLSTRLQARYGELPASWRSVGDQALQQLQDWAIRVTRQSIPALFSIVTSLFNLILIPLLAFFMLLGNGGYRQAFMAVVPMSQLKSADDLLSCTGETLWKFVKGQLALMIIIGTVTGVGLYLVGMPYPAVFGILAGLLELIPTFGPIATSVLVGIVAILISPVLAVKALSVTIGVQLLENSFLVPVVMGKTVGLNPVTVAFAIFLGGSTKGVIGAIAAIPLAMLVKIVILYFYARPEELPAGRAALCRPHKHKHGHDHTSKAAEGHDERAQSRAA